MPRRDDAILALDVDGVLLDPTRGGRGDWSMVVTERFAVDADQLRSTFFGRAWAEIIVGRAPVEPALAGVIGELGWTMSVEELLDCWFEADFVVDEEVASAVRAWVGEGVRVVLVTNQEHRRARFLNERLGAVVPISGMAYSADIGFMKKDDEFFPLACDRLGIDRNDRDIVFIDDTMENVEAGRRHGWTAVHFTKASGWRAEISAALSLRR